MADPLDSNVALPRERRFYVDVEASFGTHAKPVGADAVRILSGLLGSPIPTRAERVDNRPTRSIESKITGSTPPIEWSAEGYLIPSGAAGTAPDWGPLLTAALGVETVTPATSVAYTPSDVQGALGSLTLTDYMSAVMMQAIAGCWVEELKLAGSSGDPVMISASGAGASGILTARDEVTTVVTTTVTPVDIDHVEVGSVVAFVDDADGVTVIDDNSGAGFRVVSKGASTYVVDASPAGVSPGNLIVPFAPTEVVAGSPAPGTVGSCTIDGITIPCLSWEVAIKNNIQPHADEAFQPNATGYHEDNRQVTGQVTLRAHADQIANLTKRKAFGALAITIVVGNTAGDIMTISMPTAELSFANVDTSQPESAVITLPFQALGTANEIAITFT